MRREAEWAGEVRREEADVFGVCFKFDDKSYCV